MELLGMTSSTSEAALLMVDRYLGSGCLQEHYERPRQRANVSMMAGLDLLKRLFTPQEGLLANMRNLGLDTVNIMPAVKQQIMKYAMG